MKKPKRWTSWRVCPKCGSRATKMFSLNTGKYQCQVCDHEYEGPEQRDAGVHHPGRDPTAGEIV